MDLGNRLRAEESSVSKKKYFSVVVLRIMYVTCE